MNMEIIMVQKFTKVVGIGKNHWLLHATSHLFNETVVTVFIFC